MTGTVDTIGELHVAIVGLMQQQSRLRRAVLALESSEPLEPALRLALQSDEEVVQRTLRAELALGTAFDVSCTCADIAASTKQWAQAYLTQHFVGAVPSPGTLQRICGTVHSALRELYPRMGNYHVPLGFWHVSATESSGAVAVSIAPHSLKERPVVLTPVDSGGQWAWRAESDGLFVVGPNAVEAYIVLGLTLEHRDSSIERLSR